MRTHLLVLLGLCTAAPSCGRTPTRTANAAGGHVVDSLVPAEVALERFRAPLPKTDTLADGASTRDELVRVYLKAIEARDTSALDRLSVSKAEFAYLYYPTAPQARPPYDLSPDLLWFMLFERSNQGLRRALQRFGGQPMRYLGVTCGDSGHREGANVVYGPCHVRWRDGAGKEVTAGLLGQLLERDGRYKVLSYGNKL